MPYLQTLLLHLLHGKEKSPVFHQQLWFPCHWGAQSLAVHPARWVITTGLGCRMPFLVRSTCDWHRPTILGTGLMLISHIHKQEYSTHTSLSNLHGPENSFSYAECWFLGLLTISSLFCFGFFPSQWLKSHVYFPAMKHQGSFHFTNPSSFNTQTLAPFDQRRVCSPKQLRHQQPSSTLLQMTLILAEKHLISNVWMPEVT